MIRCVLSESINVLLGISDNVANPLYIYFDRNALRGVDTDVVVPVPMLTNMALFRS
jgi:hypothetical protein